MKKKEAREREKKEICNTSWLNHRTLKNKQKIQKTEKNVIYKGAMTIMVNFALIRNNNVENIITGKSIKSYIGIKIFSEKRKLENFISKPAL